MQPVLVLDVVGLSMAQIGEETPHLASLAVRGAAAPMRAQLPGLTCSAQATMLTGRPPAEHGIVANGWFYRDQGEVWLWRQSNALVRGEKIYERARRHDPSFTCAKLFWWWNMGAAVDWSLTPKPFYPADGRKILAIYGTPRGFEEETERELGPFPFFEFWGPRSGLGSSEWIARATMRTLERHRPTLTLAYLPHLDYDHQRFGPSAPRSRAALGEIDAIVGRLVAKADALGVETVVVSEYSIEQAERPVFLNRTLRTAGLLAVRRTPVGEVLDTFASRAFAVVDHQIAHVYTRDEAALRQVRALVQAEPGVAEALDRSASARYGLNHERAGDLVVVAERGAWFAYPFWLDDDEAPDFARTVDIHRKPGYDPCELFVDPALRWPALRVGVRLAQKALGMRYLMDVVPLDATLVGGTHGRLPDREQDGPAFLCSSSFARCGGEPAEGVVEPTSIPERLLALLQR